MMTPMFILYSYQIHWKFNYISYAFANLRCSSLFKYFVLVPCICGCLIYFVNKKSQLGLTYNLCLLNDRS